METDQQGGTRVSDSDSNSVHDSISVSNVYLQNPHLTKHGLSHLVQQVSCADILTISLSTTSPLERIVIL